MFFIKWGLSFLVGNTHASMLIHTGRIDKENFISSREALQNNETTHPDKNQSINNSPHIGTQVILKFRILVFFYFYIPLLLF